MVKELDCQWSLLLIVIHLNLGSKLVCAIAVDVTKVDSTEAWWNQSTLHSMAQRRGGVRVLSTAWHRGLVGSEYSPRHGTEAWWVGSRSSPQHGTEAWWVGSTSSPQHGTESWWGQGAVAQLPCSVVEDP